MFISVAVFLFVFAPFLLVDKIVFGLLAFGDACFSFCIELNIAQRMFVKSSSIFEISVKFQSFLLFLVVS